MMMNLLESLSKDKLTLIAMHTLIKELATGLGVDLSGSVSGMCAHAQVNRTQVYEKRGHLREALKQVYLSCPGRPPRDIGRTDGHDVQACALRERVLRYRLCHPGAMVDYGSGQVRTSNGFKRTLLDWADAWEGSLEDFCVQVEIPYSTFRDWQQQDRLERIEPEQVPATAPVVPESASEATRAILEVHRLWEGSLRDFLKFASAKMRLPVHAIRRVLVICKVLGTKGFKPPRYRGSTRRIRAGSILVTDGKEVDVVSTHTGEVYTYNWQAMVDQNTACHTAGVVTDTECAAGVHAAFEASCAFVGTPPLALVHDSKPIYQEAGLRSHVAASTVMIEATLGRAQNKAVVEGEFGKFAQQVGDIYLDDSDPDRLRKSVLREVIRGYTAGINHAGRFEFGGKSRLEVLRDAGPPTEKDRAFVEQLRQAHNEKRPSTSLPTAPVARRLLDAGFAHFAIEALDPEGTLRQWLSCRFSPEAIRQALAIFGTVREKGRIRNSTAHRYLVKVIQNCQDELDLRGQEERLFIFAREERQAWLSSLQEQEEQLHAAHPPASDPRELAFRFTEAALFGSLILERSFWENRLEAFLLAHQELFRSVCNHIRRLWEGEWLDRFQLLDKVIAWQHQTVRVNPA